MSLTAGLTLNNCANQLRPGSKGVCNGEGGTATKVDILDGFGEAFEKSKGGAKERLSAFFVQ